MLSFLTESFQRSNRASEHPLSTDNNAKIVEFLPPKSPKDSFCMRITLKQAEILSMKQQGIPSSHSPPYHWHWTQSEIFQVEKGAFFLILDDKSYRITADDGPVTVPPGVYHTYELDFTTGEDLVFVVWSPEEDGVEEIFFRNLFSYLDDCLQSGSEPSMFQMLLFLHSHDVSLALPGLPKWLAKVVSKWGLGFIGGKVIGNWLLGYQSCYKEYVNVENDKTK